MMGMFGNRAKVPPFGAQTPPLAPAAQQQPLSLGMGYQAPQEQPHGFNAPGGWADKLGGIGALLLSAGGNPAGPQMFGQIQQRQALANQQATHAQNLQDTRDTWLQQQQWEREHPKPVNNDTVNDYGFIKETLGEDAARNYLTNKTTAPPLVQHNPDGTLEVFPAGMIPRGGSSAPAGPPVGTVEGGYRFKGGDTKDPSNWELIGGAGAQAPARFPSSVMDAVIDQESGGRAGILGPQTQYGQAQGLAQVMPGTAQQMAAKLGIAWQPSLMTGKDPASAAYQRQMGQAYLDQGMAATGNLPDALRYYHGGPNRKLWGPKTNAYAQNVLARLGNR